MQNFTYTQLQTLVPQYAERSDTAFAAQVPVFIALAENRIATEMKQQGFQSVVTGALPLSNVLTKPSFWKSTISFNYTDATGAHTPITLRALEYVRNVYPNGTTTGAPRYYADYNATHFLLGPSPSAAFAFELIYFARLQPLGSNNDSNWLTYNAPQALFAAVMVEAYRFAKNSGRQAAFEEMYQGAIGGIKQENSERQADRGTVFTRP